MPDNNTNDYLNSSNTLTKIGRAIIPGSLPISPRLVILAMKLMSGKFDLRLCEATLASELKRNRFSSFMELVGKLKAASEGMGGGDLTAAYHFTLRVLNLPQSDKLRSECLSSIVAAYEVDKESTVERLAKFELSLQKSTFDKIQDNLFSLK